MVCNPDFERRASFAGQLLAGIFRRIYSTATLTAIDLMLIIERRSPCLPLQSLYSVNTTGHVAEGHFWYITGHYLQCV